LRQLFVRTTIAAALLLGVAAAAGASDAVQVGVTPVGSPTPIITEAGHGITPGTFAIGDITLDYVVIDSVFPTGLFAQFDVNLGVLASTKRGTATAYPVELSLTDIGSPNVNMTSTPNPLSISGISWTGSSRVSIYIPATVAADADLNADGSEIVGNLKLETPPGSHMDTPTSIKVRIKLVHPTACVRFFDFITDAELETTYSSIDIKFHPTTHKLQNTTPGRLSNNLLVVNTCGATETFDLKVTLDSLFTTAPSNNPGNAVFTYSAAGEVDPNTFLLSSFGAGTPRGQQLCLQNLSIAAGTTLLTTVKMDLAAPANTYAADLPAGFTFGGTLFGAGSGCSGSVDPLPSPNPVSAVLSWVAR
jgi:hypothetical protein